MGRRATHTADELRTLILDAAQGIIERDGLAGLSARSIARDIDYSPGTLYNMFENLDDVVLHIEARILDDLDRRLAAVPSQSSPAEQLRMLARTYHAFTCERPKLWNLLFEHHLPASTAIPDWYRVKLDGLLAHVEVAIEPLMGQGDGHKRAARVLWTGVHGISSLATSDKLVTISADSAQHLMEDLVTTYVRGLGVNAA